jgi:murein DD-endopeptidase MepM/ murein hydrolase activator NlpD
LIYKNDQVSYLEVILTNESFSDFFDQIKYTEEIHTDIKSSLTKLKNSKQDLETQRTNWEEKAQLEEDLKNELQQNIDGLDEKNTAQEILLVQARLTERQYQNFQYQLQLEQQQINSDIINLEKEVREKLEAREFAERFSGFGPARLAWPVNPSRGITAFFHDPDYPFRYIFEHPAIDIRAYQGTTIQAPENGYVARVKFRGDTSYAYVMLIHNDGLSTVFGHVSSVLVNQDEYVTKGQTVALTGGMPGTNGAGNLSTGPHLHFEVRFNGIPVNPLEYLPPF